MGGGEDILAAVEGPGFRLFDQVSGETLITFDEDVRLFDPSVLGLGAGYNTLGLDYIDAYDGQSTRPTVRLKIAADGSPDARMIPPSKLQVQKSSGGSLLLRWQATDAEGQYIVPDEYEIAEGGARTIVATVMGRRGVFEQTLGPYTDGETVRLAVRASDGEPAGVRGPWVDANPVVAAASGPSTPAIVAANT